MALPEPRLGLVVRYDYLWNREAAAKHDHGKDRPACLVAASDKLARPRFVVLLPITHSQPDIEAAAVEIPAAVRQAVGLDDAPCWVIVSEHNLDEWPNGLSPIPGKNGSFSYGVIPPKLFSQIRAKFLAWARENRSGGVRR